MNSTHRMFLVFALMFGAVAAANADTGKTTWHASADYEQHACDAARLGALQASPYKAKMIDGGQCSCSKNASGRVDCNVTITWETPPKR